MELNMIVEGCERRFPSSYRTSPPTTPKNEERKKHSVHCPRFTQLSSCFRSSIPNEKSERRRQAVLSARFFEDFDPRRSPFAFSARKNKERIEEHSSERGKKSTKGRQRRHPRESAKKKQKRKRTKREPGYSCTVFSDASGVRPIAEAVNLAVESDAPADPERATSWRN